MLWEQSRALHHSPAAHRCWGSRKCHWCDPQSLIYEPGLPSSKRLSFLLTEAAAREGSVWVPPRPPALIRGPSPGASPSRVPPAPRFSRVPELCSGSVLCPGHTVWPRGPSRVTPVGTQPMKLTTPPPHPQRGRALITACTESFIIYYTSSILKCRSNTLRLCSGPKAS